MANYIDGFAFPIAKQHIDRYRLVAEDVAAIWRAHGALDYAEFICDDPSLEGTLSFATALNATAEEVVIFGWVAFESREARDLANQTVAADPKIEELVGPLMNSDKPIFNQMRMAYGGFTPLILSKNSTSSDLTR